MFKFKKKPLPEEVLTNTSNNQHSSYSSNVERPRLNLVDNVTEFSVSPSNLLNNLTNYFSNSNNSPDPSSSNPQSSPDSYVELTNNSNSSSYNPPSYNPQSSPDSYVEQSSPDSYVEQSSPDSYVELPNSSNNLPSSKPSSADTCMEVLRSINTPKTNQQSASSFINLEPPTTSLPQDLKPSTFKLGSWSPRGRVNDVNELIERFVSNEVPLEYANAYERDRLIPDDQPILQTIPEQVGKIVRFANKGKPTKVAHYDPFDPQQALDICTSTVGTRPSEFYEHLHSSFGELTRVVGHTAQKQAMLLPPMTPLENPNVWPVLVGAGIAFVGVVVFRMFASEWGKFTVSWTEAFQNTRLDRYWSDVVHGTVRMPRQFPIPRNARGQYDLVLDQTILDHLGINFPREVNAYRRVLLDFDKWLIAKNKMTLALHKYEVFCNPATAKAFFAAFPSSLEHTYLDASYQIAWWDVLSPFI